MIGSPIFIVSIVLLPNSSGIPCFLLCLATFLSDPGIPGVRSMGPSLSNSLTEGLVETIQVIDSIKVIQVIQVIDS